MSHFVLLVIGKGNLEDRMAPFNEQPHPNDKRVKMKFVRDPDADWDKKQHRCGYWRNPQAKWDWYQVGGRWTGYFKLKEGVEPVLGDVGAFGCEARDGYGDIVKKGDIDLESMMSGAKKEAEIAYDSWEELRAGRPVKSWEQLSAEAKAKGKDEDWLRDTYHKQPVIKEFIERAKSADAALAFFANPSPFIHHTRDQYIRMKRASQITPFAFLKPDGTWVEKGEMGWFGMASNEKTQLDWSVAFMEYFHALPDNTKITVVDCHI